MGDADHERRRTCFDYSPPWFTGRWRDWHRGHACHLDDGKPRSAEGEREIEQHENGAAPKDDPGAK